MTRTFVFPGQGSQVVGMGKDFYDNFQTAKDVFLEADEVLEPLYGHALSPIIFDGPDSTLTQTLYTQPALMVTSIAVFRTREKELGKPLHTYATLLAGHSLGEYSALCAAGVLSLKDTAYLLYHRGKAMTECVPPDGGAMAALIGLEMDSVEEITKQAKCFIANDNGGGQVVISGSKEDVTHAMDLAQKAGAKRALALNVSAPFHCPLMIDAARIMKEKIAEITFFDAPTPVITNVSALPQTDANSIKEHLVDQICGRVRWRESVFFMAEQGVTESIEIGSGKVLTGLCKRIAPDITASYVSTIHDIDNFLVTLQGKEAG